MIVPREQKKSFTPASFREYIYFTSGLLEVATFIGGLDRHTFNLRQLGVRPDSTQWFEALVPTYPEGKVPIKVHKVNAVRAFIWYVPEKDRRTQAYYKAYLEWPTTTGRGDNEED